MRKIFFTKLRGYIKADREKAAKEGRTRAFIWELLQNACLPDHSVAANVNLARASRGHPHAADW